MILFASSFLISFVINFLVIKSNLINARDYKNGIQKFHTWDAVRIGGVGIFLGFSFSAFLLFEDKVYTCKLIIACLPVFIGGLLEDIMKKINAKLRLLFAFASGILSVFLLDAYLTRVDFTIFDYFLKNYFIVSVLFTSFALAGVANAINIIDGFNGLASGVGLIIFTSYAYVSFILNDELLFAVSISYLGALLGFFLWNFPKGRIFLGDGGAYLTGFLGGLIGVLMVNRHPEASAWFPLTLMFYPVWETLFSIYRRIFIQGYSSTEPDVKHLHSLIYKRIIKKELSENRPSWLLNSLTSPYLWFLELICAIPAVMFWDNTLALISTCIIFAIFYTWFYGRLVKFKVPKIAKILIPKYILRSLQ